MICGKAWYSQFTRIPYCQKRSLIVEKGGHMYYLVIFGLFEVIRGRGILFLIAIPYIFKFALVTSPYVSSVWLRSKSHGKSDASRGHSLLPSWTPTRHQQVSWSAWPPAEVGRGQSQLVPRHAPHNPRLFTPRECARIMGFPEHYQLGDDTMDRRLCKTLYPLHLSTRWRRCSKSSNFQNWVLAWMFETRTSWNQNK